MVTTLTVPRATNLHSIGTIVYNPHLESKEDEAQMRFLYSDYAHNKI